jgi:cation transport ATPase
MQHERYLTELKSRGMKFVLLTGDLEERVRKVTEALDASADNF